MGNYFVNIRITGQSAEDLWSTGAEELATYFLPESLGITCEEVLVTMGRREDPNLPVALEGKLIDTLKYVRRRYKCLENTHISQQK